MTHPRILLIVSSLLLLSSVSLAQQQQQALFQPQIRSQQVATAKAVIQNWNLSLWKRLGTVFLSEIPGSNQLKITGTLTGLTPGFHGFHIHGRSDLENGCPGAGGHYNPDSAVHSSPTSANRHVGDLGNVFADVNGIAVLDIVDNVASLFGPQSIVGRTFVIHAGQDDLGLGGDAGSLKTGNAGGRVGCGIIGITSSDFSSVVAAADGPSFGGSITINSIAIPKVFGPPILNQPSPPICRDENTSGFCTTWRAFGYCKPMNVYRTFMEDNCKLSCGFCLRRR